MITLFLTAAAAVQLVHVDDPDDRDFGAVLALGIDTQVQGLGSMLEVYTADGPDGRPPIFGRVAIVPSGLRFQPRFTFVTDLIYVAIFDLPAYCRRAGCRATERLHLRFRMPDPPDSAGPKVIGVSPAARALPANLLRFYVHFSRPMRPVDVHEHVRLLAADGRSVHDAFVVVRQGLWDRARQRLTLIVHPGRIKRGVGPNMTQGPVLRPGRRYRLVIDRRLRDAEGTPLDADFTHGFDVKPAIRRRLRPQSWSLTAPPAPRAAVTVRADRPLDRALLKRLLRVERLDGRSVPGSVRVDEDDRRWSFRPREPWTRGDYRVMVPRALEDLAGNTVDYRFEEAPATLPSDADRSAGPIALPFSVDTFTPVSK